LGDIIIALVIGLFGGFAGGLLGIGGGAIFVPAMVLLLDEDQKLAQGASLAAIIATAIVGSFVHVQKRNVDIPTVLLVAPAAVVAGFGAAFLADALHADVLRRIFAVVALYLGATTALAALRGPQTPVPEGETS
jgi:hypothetical protein